MLHKALQQSPDDKRVLSTGSDRTVRLWDLATGRVIQVFEGHSDDVRSAMFSPDGHSAISTSLDGTLRLWALP